MHVELLEFSSSCFGMTASMDLKGLLLSVFAVAISHLPFLYWCVIQRLDNGTGIPDGYHWERFATKTASEHCQCDLLGGVHLPDGTLLVPCGECFPGCFSPRMSPQCISVEKMEDTFDGPIFFVKRHGASE